MSERALVLLDADEAKRRFEILARQVFIRFKALLMEASRKRRVCEGGQLDDQSRGGLLDANLPSRWNEQDKGFDFRPLRHPRNLSESELAAAEKIQ